MYNLRYFLLFCFAQAASDLKQNSSQRCFRWTSGAPREQASVKFSSEWLSKIFTRKNTTQFFAEVEVTWA